MIRKLVAAGWIVLLGLSSSPLWAYLLPGDFVLSLTQEGWKESKGIVLLRDVVEQGAQSAYQEEMYLREGHLRVHAPLQDWTYPELPIPDGSRREEFYIHRPGIVDAIFLQGEEGFGDELKRLGIDVGRVSLGRQPTSDSSLPFVVVYRLGADGRPTTPQLHIEKEQWRIRRLQFRERNDPDGILWMADYDGFGAVEGVPEWVPTRIQVYRAGQHFQSITAVRTVNTKIRESIFTPRAPARKPLFPKLLEATSPGL